MNCLCTKFSKSQNTVTYPNAILPPVCLVWPLFIQLMDGKGWPDTWHSSTTWAPKGTVNTWGHSLTDGWAVRKGKHCLEYYYAPIHIYIYMYIYISSEIVRRAARCHTQNSECCSSRGKRSLKMGVWGPAEVAATIVLLHTTEKIMKRVSRASKNKNQLPGAVFKGTIL